MPGQWQRPVSPKLHRSPHDELRGFFRTLRTSIFCNFQVILLILCVIAVGLLISHYRSQYLSLNNPKMMPVAVGPARKVPTQTGTCGGGNRGCGGTGFARTVLLTRVQSYSHFIRY